MVLYRIVYPHPIYGTQIMVSGVWHSEGMANRALRAMSRKHPDICYRVIAN